MERIFELHFTDEAITIVAVANIQRVIQVSRSSKFPSFFATFRRNFTLITFAQYCNSYNTCMCNDQEVQVSSYPKHFTIYSTCASRNIKIYNFILNVFAGGFVKPVPNQGS